MYLMNKQKFEAWRNVIDLLLLTCFDLKHRRQIFSKSKYKLHFATKLSFLCSEKNLFRKYDG